MFWCLLFLVSSLSLGPVFSQTGLSASEKQTILNEHNRLRGLVRPTAANMQRMVGTNLHMPCEAMLVPYMVATEWLCLARLFIYLFLQSWNDDLAVVAQNYAERCIFAHNSDRDSQQSTFTSVGENLFAVSGAANYTSAVLNWYNEVQYYTYSSNSCTQDCGHYTQVRIVQVFT